METSNNYIFTAWLKTPQRETLLSLFQYLGFTQCLDYSVRFKDFIKS